MTLDELNEIPNSDWINVTAEIIKAYLANKEEVKICRSWMDEGTASNLRANGYFVNYNQYDGYFIISGWNTEMWSDK